MFKAIEKNDECATFSKDETEEMQIGNQSKSEIKNLTTKNFAKDYNSLRSDLPVEKVIVDLSCEKPNKSHVVGREQRTDVPFKRFSASRLSMKVTEMVRSNLLLSLLLLKTKCCKQIIAVQISLNKITAVGG